MNRPDSIRPARRVGLFLIGVMVWTLFAMYPNPAVLARNLLRYHRLPLDPEIERKMGWDLPSEPAAIEFFVSSIILSRPDWIVHRVPWYVPTAEEAARAVYGDCETRAILLASLFEGRGVPYEVRASLTHIWVDYPGRPERPDEARDIAYLEGTAGRLGVRLPERVPWREVLALQREQLWDPMPPVRRAIWLLGLAWVAAAALVLGGGRPRGDLVSVWRTSLRSSIGRAAELAVLALAIAIAAPALRRAPPPVRYTAADLWELLALAALAGAALAWAAVVRPRRAVVFEDGEHLGVRSSLGLWRWARSLPISEIDRFELASLPGRGWRVAAALRRGERVTLLRSSREVAARAALRRLGRQCNRPILTRAGGFEHWTAADEIGLSLREKAARRPRTEPPPQPGDCHLHSENAEGAWALGYLRPDPTAVRTLAGLAGAIAAAALGAAALLTLFPASAGVWLVWAAIAVVLGMTAYAAISLRDDVLAWLGGARVQVGEHELSFHAPDGRVESLPLDDIESVEISRRGGALTLAVVSPERIVHVRLACQANHLEWVQSALEAAIARSP